METADSKNYRVDTSTLFGPFKSHLEILSNDRVFFSGRFGIGKTTFLKDFFSVHSKDYEVFQLYPVNYQINSNENIIDLLKYDILIEILKKAEQSGEKAFSDKTSSGVKEQMLLFQSFLSSTYSLHDVLNKTLEYGTGAVEIADSVFKTKFHKLGRPLQDLLVFDKSWQSFKKSQHKNALEEISKFKESVEIREDSVMTHLIHKEIEKIEKTSVLIIDDLDRIDPEHIFRILNIFSGFHEREGGNKFGFDKVIIVGDVSNLEHIFHHFYGKDTDFTGYIDKFFSRDIYLFSSREAIGSELNKIMKVFGQSQGVVIEDFRPDFWAYDILHHILTDAVQRKGSPFTLRQIVKMMKFNESILAEANFKRVGNGRVRLEQTWSAFEFAFKACEIIFEEKSKFAGFCEWLQNSIHQNNAEDNFYALYSVPLLYKATGTDWHTEMFPAPNSMRRWNGYEIQREGSGLIKIIQSPDSKNIRFLFYDLLAACVRDRV